MSRRRFKQPSSLEDRLLLFADRSRQQAENLRPGKERDDLLRKARKADATVREIAKRLDRIPVGK